MSQTRRWLTIADNNAKATDVEEVFYICLIRTDAGQIDCPLIKKAMKTKYKVIDYKNFLNDLADLLMGDEDYWVLLETLLKKKCKNGKNALEELFGFKKIFPSQIKKNHSSAKKLARQMICCFAFRQKYQPIDMPDCYKNLVYKTFWVDKGKKKSRRIDVPTNCLKRIQKYFLEKYLNYHLARLPEYVVSKPRGSAIKGASLHLDSKYSVNVDIKDFFPSINASMVIPTLKNLYWVNKTGSQEKSFDHKSAVLAGRLLTYRNFLPQGSPTSPAIANLVFDYHDKEIIKELGTHFRYSRYIDDVTVSISSKDAKDLMIDNMADMRRRALSAIEKVLDGSGFRLNQSKIDSFESTRETGHFVTGYHVRGSNITLPKVDRRFFRGLTKRIETSGFNLALLATEIVPKTSKANSPSPGNKNKFLEKASKVIYDKEKKRHFNPTRKLSLETLAIKLASSIHKGLKILDIALDYQNEIEQLNLDNNAGVKRYMEDVVGMLWNGDLVAGVGDKPNSIFIKKIDNTLVCSLAAENRPNFFMLKKQVALACMEYYMWISGQIGRLYVPEELQHHARNIHLIGLSLLVNFKKLTINLSS